MSTVVAEAVRTPRRYASATIAQRRKRILDATLQLIGEMGADGFTLRDLGRRAEVSVTTIYNIFGDKEGVIGHALREFHGGIKLSFPARASDLSGFLEIIASTTDVVLANRAYALALGDLYFSRSLTPKLFEVIRGMPLAVFDQWLWLAERDRILESSRKDEAARSFANLEWGSVKDWGAGRIADSQLARVRQHSFLTAVMVVASEPIAQAARRLLAEID
jgi:AcrR family transcriptional regulator